MKTFTIALLAMGLLVALAPAASAQDACKSSFDLVGKDDLKWYVDGGAAANPTITACPSTAVTFSLVTEGTQVHNFQVQGGGAPAATATFAEGDDPVEYAWTTPASGSFKYICVIHGTAMSGTVNVASTASATPTGGDESKDSPGFEVVFLGLAAVAVALLYRRK